MIDFRERHVMALVIKATRVLYGFERLAPLSYRSSFFAVLNFVVQSWTEVNFAVIGPSQKRRRNQQASCFR